MVVPVKITPPRRAAVAPPWNVAQRFTCPDGLAGGLPAGSRQNFRVCSASVTFSLAGCANSVPNAKQSVAVNTQPFEMPIDHDENGRNIAGLYIPVRRCQWPGQG
jgi:hypothetical protein